MRTTSSPAKDVPCAGSRFSTGSRRSSGGRATPHDHLPRRSRGRLAVRTKLQVLSADEQAQIHERTLKVLATVGMRVDTEEGRRLLAAAGAEVGEATRTVRFPPALVEESLRSAPKYF